MSFNIHDNITVSNNNLNKHPQVAFKAQFKTDDLKLLMKYTGPKEENYIDNIVIYTLVKYIKELPGKCAKLIKGNNIENNPKWYEYELHIDGKKVASGSTIKDDPQEACGNALVHYAIDAKSSDNPNKISIYDLKQMFRENINKSEDDILKLAIDA